MKLGEAQIEAVVAQYQREGSPGGVHPTADQLRALLRHEGDGPVQMVNLLAFKQKADYPPDHPLAGDAGGTGAEAYARYAEVALRRVAALGGRLVLLGRADQVVVGDLPDWDQVAIVEYPSRAAFLALPQDPEYRAALLHREAGLARTALVAMTPLADPSRD